MKIKHFQQHIVLRNMCRKYNNSLKHLRKSGISDKNGRASGISSEIDNKSTISAGSSGGNIYNNYYQSLTITAGSRDVFVSAQQDVKS